MTEIDEQNAKLEAECDRLHRALDAAYATSELFAAECLRWRRAHADIQPPVVTVCCSCGADPNVYPETGAELPIVRGALDAQAHAEQRMFATREKCQECDRLRSAIREAKYRIRSGARNLALSILDEAAFGEGER